MADSIQNPSHGDKSTDEIAEPGESIRCSISQNQASELAKQLYGLTVTAIDEFNGYDDRNFYLTVENTFTNEFIKDLWPHGYVLKIVNILDSKKPDYIEAQSLLFRHIDARIPGCCPLPVLNTNGQLHSLESIYQEDEQGNRISDTPSKHLVRLLTFKPGRIFNEIPQPDFDVFFECGQELGKLHQAFKDFSHSGLHNRNNIWSMAKVPQCKDYLFAVRDPERRALAEKVIEAFAKKVVPNFDHLPKGVIHGDFNEQNILVTPKMPTEEIDSTTKFKYSAVLDLGESAYLYRVMDIGVTIMYLGTSCKALDFIEVGGHVLAGYLSKIVLSDLELDLLKIIVEGRYAQSLVLGEYSYKLDNNEYCLVTGIHGWGQLERLWATPQDKLMGIWRSVIAKRRQ